MGWESDFGPTVKELDPLIGSTVGNYVVERELARGGMGVVYAARHPDIGRKVAIKVVFARFATDAGMVQRFKMEALSVNQIGHPNIIDVFDFGMLPDGRPYLVMEFLHGEDLDARLTRQGRLAYEQAAPILRQSLDALEAAHAGGVVHRDLKPDNIFLARSRGGEVVKLLDFGIAKLRQGPAGVGTTADGTLMGTPLYMSPEQAMGRQSGIGPASDIYSMGVILYRIFTGDTPFVGAAFGELMIKHMQEEPVPPSQKAPGLDPLLDEVILRCLRKAPEERFANAGALREALTAIVPRMAVANVTALTDQFALTVDSGPVPLMDSPRPTPPSAPAVTPPASVEAAPPSSSRARVGIAIAVAGALLGAGAFVVVRAHGPAPLPPGEVEQLRPPWPEPIVEGRELKNPLSEKEATR